MGKTIPYLWQKLEPVITVLFLLVIFDVRLPGPTQSLFNMGSYGIVFLLILPYWRRVLYVATRDWLIWVLVGLALFSYFWSADPTATLASGKGLIRAMLFSAYFAARYTPMQQMRLFAWMTGLGAVLSTAVSLAIPSYGRAGSLWRGIYAHKQYLGRMMAVGAITQALAFVSSRKYRWLPLLGFGLAIALILLSQSKTALVLSLLFVSALPLYRIIRYYYKAQVIFYMLILLVGSAVALFILADWQSLVVNALGKDPNLTGREEIWALALNRGMEHPWLGYGYSGFWKSAAGEFVIRHSWAKDALAKANVTGGFHAHNGFIEVFLWLGWVGLALFVIHFITVLLRVIKLFRLVKKVEYFWMLQIVLLMLLYNTTEVVQILSQGSQLWLAYVSIAFSSALQLERIRRSHPLSPIAGQETDQASLVHQNV